MDDTSGESAAAAVPRVRRHALPEDAGPVAARLGGEAIVGPALEPRASLASGEAGTRGPASRDTFARCADPRSNGALHCIGQGGAS